MDMSFDIRGFLKPYEKVRTDLESVKNVFVTPFGVNSSRHELYNKLLEYNNKLSDLLEREAYSQWINGSFISLKESPRDIDLVSFISSDIVSRNQVELQSYIGEKGRKKFGIDGYIVKVYSEDHAHFVRTKSDYLYWEHWFGWSRKNRRRERFQKGFIEILF